jgi:hypothetical protein
VAAPNPSAPIFCSFVPFTVMRAGRLHMGTGGPSCRRLRTTRVGPRPEGGPPMSHTVTVTVAVDGSPESLAAAD